MKPYLAAVSLILNIDTAVETASLCLAENGVAISVKSNPTQKDHAAWLQPAIASMFKEASVSINDLDGVAVSAGPGSYTGLRVGMASAKGLCFAGNKPLVLVSTLQMMAAGAATGGNELLCPLIDARRMEVFTAIYDQVLNELLTPHNCILSEDYFDAWLQQPVIFFGNGSSKLKGLVSHSNAIFKQIEITAEQMADLSYQRYKQEAFADLAYSEPLYGKEFYSPALKKM